MTVAALVLREAQHEGLVSGWLSSVQAQLEDLILSLSKDEVRAGARLVADI